MNLDKIQLQFYTDDEIRRIAVVQVKNPATYDRGLPKANGVNDARMGVTDKALQCPTCGLTSNCNNHYGYIELEREVIRFGHIASVLCLLRSVCWACSTPKFSTHNNLEGVDIKAILAKTLPGSKDRLRGISEACKNKFKCINPACGVPQPIYSRINKVFFNRVFRPKEYALFENEEEKEYLKRRLMPDEIKSIIKHIPREALIILGYDPEISHPSSYIMKVHLVPPPSIRPANAIASTEARLRGENDLTVALQDIVRSNNELSAAISDNLAEDKILMAWDKLQIFTSALINQNAKKLLTFNGTPVVHARAFSKRKTKVIKDRLTGKKGRLRGNLAGKRVDHAGRSVVGPDSTHDIFQLGVPSTIMRTLTFPENVNALNKDQLAQCIMRGANVSDGALTVKIPDPSNHGEKILYLSLLDQAGRLKVAASLNYGWTVERHLRNGDWVLFNRQPSLHKASIMAFQAYETSSAQFKLPLPCTKPFNADFDGDEMNMHALQDYTAIAEAQEIMAVPLQMVTPQSNSVLIALVQDSIVGAYQMTRKDAFCTKEEAIQLAMCIKYSVDCLTYSELPPTNPVSFLDLLSDLPPPAILKCGIEKSLWTGKQIFSWILHKKLSLIKFKNANINCGDDYLNEKIVVIRNGELLCGRLCKDTVGQSSGGIVHAIWKQIGPWASAKFVSDAQRILMHWLRKDTVCISIRDCLTPCENLIDKITSDAMGRVDEIFDADIPFEVKEVKQTQLLQETLRTVGATVLENMDTNSGIATVVASGSKGNLMNIAQIAGLVGQQTINGSRIAFRRGPLGQRTLANFAPNDNSPEARGFVASSYVMGLQPYEFFFHQQAGREGVVATAVSTADTGYNQRRMVKNQESEVISYDLSVRVSSNLIVQLHYNGDDYDGTMVERVNFVDASQFAKLKSEKKYLQEVYEMLRSIKKCSLKYGIEEQLSVSMPVNFLKVVQSIKAGQSNSKLVCINHKILLQNLLSGILSAHGQHISGNLNELTFRPHRNVITEDDPSLQARLCLALQCTSQIIAQYNITEQDARLIEQTFLSQYTKGIVNPGEGVGAVGSSSIGEPSTQMTLNIFHYSGIAEKNVTLTGLPRFKQIINAVDTFDTANMTIALNNLALGENSDSHKYNARAFAARQAKTLLSKIVQNSFLRNGMEENDSSDLKLLFKIEDLCKNSFDVPVKLNHSKSKKITEKRIQSIVDTKHKVNSYSTVVAIYEIDKASAYCRHLTIEEIGSGLESFMGSDAIVTWNTKWCDNWFVMIRPPSWGDHALDVMVTETIHDALLEHAIVNGMDGIKKAVVIKTDSYKVETEGSDLLSIAQLPEVNPLSTSTNNIKEVGRIFGVEAGLCLMQAELHKVLSFDGSYVDPRHTWLLADTVARSGCINPLNRHKMEELGGSLLQCASFEQTLEVFEHGAAFAKSDNLGGATEKLIVGQPVHVGTGSFGILSDIKETYSNVIVAPMINDEEMAEVKVKSLHNEQKPPNNLSNETYSGHPCIENLCKLFSIMRKCALDRVPVWIQCNIIPMGDEMSFEEFQDIEKLLMSYKGWTKWSKEFSQITDVIYLTDDTQINSKVEFINDMIIMEHFAKHVYDEFKMQLPEPYNLWKICASAETRKKIPSEYLPASVEPTTVRISQYKQFDKGPWRIKLCKNWSAKNNIEAEKLLLSGTKNATSFEAIIELIEPWKLMEERGCTDISMSASLIERVNYCLDSIQE